MLYNYFNIALRNLLKNKTHTLINILGLGLGNSQRVSDRALY